MNVVAAINCADAECFSKRLETARGFLTAGSWLHVDVSESDAAIFQSFVDWDLLGRSSNYFRFEVHLMVSDNRLKDLADIPAHRLLVHWRQASLISESVRRAGKELGMVIYSHERPETLDLPREAKYIEVLAVPPGPSGSGFREEAIESVKFLRKHHRDATITVDGGITPQVAARCGQAGADAVISASYIWSADDPAAAYRELLDV